LRGKIWDENTTDAEIDRADLLAILDAVLPDALQVVQYAKTYADGDIWRAACRLLPILGALEGGGGQEVPR
jgi:hypothetical protein